MSVQKPVVHNIYLPHGNSHAFDVIVLKDGLPLDLLDCKLWWTAKHDVTDADADAVFQKINDQGDEAPEGGIVITDESASEITLKIFAEDTIDMIADTNLEHCLRVLEPTGDVTSLVVGKIMVRLVATKAIE